MAHNGVSRAPETFGAAGVKGLVELQRALRRVEGDAGKDLKRRLRVIAVGVQGRARGNVSHKTGRHGEGPTIGQSLRVSVTQRGASLYTTAPHGFVQDRGGQVGRNRATLLRRDSVSQYMTRAVVSEQAHVRGQLAEMLDDFGREFEK